MVAESQVAAESAVDMPAHAADNIQESGVSSADDYMLLVTKPPSVGV